MWAHRQRAPRDQGQKLAELLTTVFLSISGVSAHADKLVGYSS
jgi:hypothetical protein